MHQATIRCCAICCKRVRRQVLDSRSIPVPDVPNTLYACIVFHHFIDHGPRTRTGTLHWATVHRLTGIAAALAVVFVESVVVTYFIGTSRWCKEVAETYRLERTFVAASNRLKRRTFPWALAGMLSVVAIIALGGAGDPATGRPNTQWWADWHLFGACLGILLIAWTYLVAWNNIQANHAIIQLLVSEVARIRRQRGLDDSNATAPMVHSAR
jgi:hypothetical protein